MKRLFTILSLLLACSSCKSRIDESGSTLQDSDTAGKRLLKARFTQWIDVFKPIFADADGDETKAAKAIVKGQARIAAFNLQALGRIYSNLDQSFEPLRDDFKDLEDGIGAYDLWSSLDIEDKKKKAFDDLTELLKSKDWVKRNYKDSLLATHEDFIKAYAWPSYKNDRKAVVGQVKEQVDSMVRKEFDISILENERKRNSTKFGVHELRRELRWFLIEARVVNGLIRFKPDTSTCPVSIYKDLPTTYRGDPKYTTLAENEPVETSCQISQCLFLAGNKLVGTLGTIKDKAEKDSSARDTNKVPPQLATEASDVYTEIRSSKLLEELSRELGECIN